MTENNSAPAEPQSSPTPDNPFDTRRRRLLFRANHMGTHENDLMVGGFVAARIGGFSDAEIERLEAILRFPDVDLADWLSGRRAVPPEHDCPMLQAMCRAVNR